MRNTCGHGAYQPARAGLQNGRVACRVRRGVRHGGRTMGHRPIPEMAIVIAAMRKLLHLIYGVLKNQLPFDPIYGKQFAFNP